MICINAPADTQAYLDAISAATLGRGFVAAPGGARGRRGSRARHCFGMTAGAGLCDNFAQCLRHLLHDPAIAMPGHTHRTHTSGGTRAGVLGANDGILSIAGLLLGVASTHAGHDAVLLAGIAGLVAGALSMGAGEFVSVSSQADIERADLEIERRALESDFAGERAELQEIYVRRGLDPHLADQVALQLMQHDALGAHARDDIGITDALAARPLQAALASTASFTVGGALPMLAAWLAPPAHARASIAAVSLVALVLLGGLAARAGGAGVARGALRVLAWGAATMLATTAIGSALGVAM